MWLGVSMDVETEVSGSDQYMGTTGAVEHDSDSDTNIKNVSDCCLVGLLGLKSCITWYYHAIAGAQFTYVNNFVNDILKDINRGLRTADCGGRIPAQCWHKVAPVNTPHNLVSRTLCARSIRISSDTQSWSTDCSEIWARCMDIPPLSAEYVHKQHVNFVNCFDEYGRVRPEAGRATRHEKRTPEVYRMAIQK